MTSFADSERILIDVSPTLRDWRYYGDFFRCRHLWALKRIAGISEHTDPLTRGSMGHVGLAHHYVRTWAMQQGVDPDRYYTPEGAIEAWCARNPEGIPHFNRVIEMTRRYIAQNLDPHARVLRVAQQVGACLGVHTGGRGWGLWVVSCEGEGVPTAHLDMAWRLGDPRPRALLDNAEVQPTTLNMPGHPNHGAPILITTRIDVALANAEGAITAIDHKCIAQAPSKHRVKQYSMDGQFAVTRIMASQLFPRFAGAKINLVQTQDPWKVSCTSVPETPWRDSRFAVDLHRAAHEIAQLERDEPDPHHWPMAQHELVCAPRYGDQGLCPMYDACAGGPSTSTPR